MFRNLFLVTLFFLNPLQADWSHPLDVSEKGFNAKSPKIVVDKDDCSIAIWSGFDGNNYVIQSATKTLKGDWSKPVKLSKLNGDSVNPQITVDKKGNLYAVWSIKNGEASIIQSSVKYQNKDWSTTLDVSIKGVEGQDSLFPQVLFGNDGETYAIWQKNKGSANVIQFAKKEKANPTWDKPTTISRNKHAGRCCKRPQFAINQYGDLFAVWINHEKLTVEFALKHFGQNWTEPKDLSDAGKPIQNAKIALDQKGNAIATWTRRIGKNRIVQAAYRKKSGYWEEAVNLSNLEDDALLPDLSISQTGNAVIAWQKFDGFHSVIQAVTKIGNDNWSTAVNLTTKGHNASNPQTATGSNNTALVVWKISDGSNFVIQESSAIFGEQWSYPITLSEEGEDAVDPNIAVNALNNASIVWKKFNGTENIIQSTFNQF